jgi:hypothetical protein
MTDHPEDIRSLQYIVNTGGNATIEHFYDDHDPIGLRLWTSLVVQGLATFGEDRIVKLTELGQKVLDGSKKGASK